MVQGRFRKGSTIMQDIIKELTSVHWLITVGIASLVLNILASYLVRVLDRILPRFSAFVGKWTGRKVTEFSDDVDRASRDIKVATYIAARQASLHIFALHSYAMGAIFFYVGGKLKSHEFLSISIWVMGFLITMLGSGDLGGALRCRSILNAAQKKTEMDQKALKVSQVTREAIAAPEIAPGSK
ncbi:MAG: hypothetical protein JWR26_278 [Pedosphaera sp.]|nr:hypothetical protein [Pedosphaera sp.]